MSPQYKAPFTPALYPRMHLLSEWKRLPLRANATSYTFNPPIRLGTQVDHEMGQRPHLRRIGPAALTPANISHPK